MSFKTLHAMALAAALVAGGALSAQAASDDQIQYRDGQPVGGATAGDAKADDAMPAKSTDEKPMAKKTHKAGAHKGHKGKHAKHGARSPSVKHLRGHSEHPRSKL